MSISKIKQLREERKALIDKYKKELETIRNDERYAPDYKAEKIKEIERKLSDVRSGYDSEIRVLIEKNKRELQAKINKAGFEGLTEKELLQQLLIESRNKSIEERALQEFKDNPDGLYTIIQKEVESGSYTAQGYINAFMQLSDNFALKHNVKQLEEQHKVNMMNEKQKAYLKELELYEQQEAEYQEEREGETVKQALGLE